MSLTAQTLVVKFDDLKVKEKFIGKIQETKEQERKLKKPYNLLKAKYSLKKTTF